MSKHHIALGTPLRPWLVDVAERACIPLEFVACPAIVGIGAVVGRSVGIRPVRLDDYLVVPNLWGGVIARPGAMKTYAVEQGLKPLTRLAEEAKEKHRNAAALAEAHQEVIKGELDAIKKQIREHTKVQRGSPDSDGTLLEELARELAEKNQELQELKVTEPRYLTQDATVERLGELLRENPRGMLVARDELAGWLRTMDKPGREGDREFYLEGWNGSGGYTFDRIGRGTVHIDAVTISICGGIQPGSWRGVSS